MAKSNQMNSEMQQAAKEYSVFADWLKDLYVPVLDDWGHTKWITNNVFDRNYYSSEQLAVKFIEESPEKKQSGWVSVETRMPENRSYVLVANKEHIELALYKHGQWMYDDQQAYSNAWQPTHWQPLPPLQQDKD